MLEFAISPVGFLGVMGTFPHAVNAGGLEGMRIVAPLIVEKAKQYCPVDSGALRDSIYWYETNGQIVIGAGVFYAAFVEYGTSRNRAQPFLRPAINYYVNTGFTDSAIMESIENHLGL
jgi:HK97 gp10 family phage protein